MPTADEIRSAIEKKKIEVESQNPEVEKTRIKVDAVKLLADNKNPAFSELEKSFNRDETFDYTSCDAYAINPLKGLEARLKAKGIKQTIKVFDDKGNLIEKDVDVRITIPFLIEFLTQLLENRHCANRSRVQEYIRALEAASRTEILEREPPKTGMSRIFQRLG